MPLLCGYWRSTVEYVASDGMEGFVLRWKSVEDTAALAGADRVPCIGEAQRIRASRRVPPH